MRRLSPPARDDLLRSAARTPVAELVWPEGPGVWRTATVMPLVGQSALQLALTVDRTPMARSLSASRGVVLGLTDERGTARGWHSLVAVADTDVRPDPEGQWTQTTMLEQELRKSERSRRLADTPLRRREYWWYLPRWLVTLQLHRVRSVSPRAPSDGLLVLHADGELLADTVAVSSWADPEPTVRSLTPQRSLPERSDAVLFSHDRFLPDGEVQRSVTLVGQLQASRFTVARHWGDPRPPAPASLLDRLVAHRALRRACEAALRRGEPR